MIKREKLNSANQVKLTFVQQYDPAQATVSVVGDFNQWDPNTHKLIKRSNGTMSASVTLNAGQKVRFRYYRADGHWFNDEAAESYEVGEHGAENSIINI